MTLEEQAKPSVDREIHLEASDDHSADTPQARLGLEHRKDDRGTCPWPRQIVSKRNADL